MKKTKKPVNFFVWLRSSLRKISQRHPPIYAALAAAKRPYVGDNPRQKICYECAKCKGLFSAKQVAVDHVVEAGKLQGWEDVQGFMQRLFCDESGLAVLCHDCHSIKTYMFKNSVTEEEAIIQKEVINILKTESKEDVVNFIEMWGWTSNIEGHYLTNNEASRRMSLLEIYRRIT
jgi:hypothetical protein